jgi:hypothetical protein
MWINVSCQMSCDITKGTKGSENSDGRVSNPPLQNFVLFVHFVVRTLLGNSRKNHSNNGRRYR